MKWSLKLCTVAGIGVFMHWSFVLIIAYVFFIYLSQGESLLVAARGAALVLAVFGCVVLHELGHALTAKRFGVHTRDITLLPIGGLARLERMPEDPRQEYWIAVAGPAVNVGIAVVLGLLITVFGGSPFNIHLIEGNFLANLLWVNLFLVGFNMLPAFPMDGGRVLRALLAFRMDYVRATRISSAIGQAMAVGFGLAAVFTLFNPFLLIIAIFVFLGARAEAQQAQVNFAIKDLTVRDAMITRFQQLSIDDTLSKAADELLAGSQHDFPVVEDERVAGVLSRDSLIRFLAERGGDTPVREAMNARCRVVNESDRLRRTLEAMRADGCFTVPVVDEGERLVGILTLENIGELLMLDRAAHQQEQQPAP